MDELDTSGVRATHSTAEAMGKSSDWYVQQAQGRMHSLVEESVTGAEGRLQRQAEEAAQKAAVMLEQRRAEHSVELRAQMMKPPAPQWNGRAARSNRRRTAWLHRSGKC